MSHPVLSPSLSAFDVGELLENLAHAFAPIARSRGICPELSGGATPVLITTSLEEVLPPFTTLWLKLLYLLPPGSRFEVAALVLTEAEVARLRLQITTDPIWFNPNLLLSNTAKILQLDRSAKDSCVIYVDLLLDEPPVPTQPSLAPSWTLSKALQSENLAAATRQRIERFMRDGLTIDKVRASAEAKDAAFLATVGQFIDDCLEQADLDSLKLERELGLSRSQLFRRFKRLTGFSTANYIRHVRLCKARDLLETTTLTVGEVAGRVGFPELSYFSHCFTETFAQTPSEWRKRARMKQ